MSAFTYTETIRTVVVLDRCSRQSWEFYAKLSDTTRKSQVRRYLGLVAIMADDLCATLPDSTGDKPAKLRRPESLSQAVTDCCLNLALVTTFQRKLCEVRDEADLTALVARARTIAAALAASARAALDMINNDASEGAVS